MEAILERCCGLDVHQASVVACLVVAEPDKRPRKIVRTFGTMTQDLEELRAWLATEGCTHIAMEATGIYWMPVYAVLEERFELIVGNAQHIKNVPGRKTDVKDSEWLADLLRHGLIRPSFVPPRPIRELRDLVRYRRKLVQNRSSERNRLLKLLEQAGIKLSTVVSNVFGVSGMAMLEALVRGESSAEEMAHLAKSRLRRKIPELTRALVGRVDQHHRTILQMQLIRLHEVQEHINQLDDRIAARLVPYSAQMSRLIQIPGVDHIVAAGIIAELGVDMSVFANARHCASWVGVCPGNNESAGKRKSGRSRSGNIHLTTLLVEAAQAASKTKNTYLRDKFHRIRARRGYKRAALAIAHKILIAVYEMLRTGADYRELGEKYLDGLDENRVTRNLVRRLERLGYHVKLESQTNDDAQSEVPRSAEPTSTPAPSAAPENREPQTKVDDRSREPAPTSAPASAPRTEGRTPAAARSAADHSLSRPPAVDARPAVTASTRRRASAASAGNRRDPRLPPSGAILRRCFRGVDHEVLVLDDGFEHAGQYYASLSAIAKAITGTTWNGFAFFGLTGRGS